MRCLFLAVAIFVDVVPCSEPKKLHDAFLRVQEKQQSGEIIADGTEEVGESSTSAENQRQENGALSTEEHPSYSKVVQMTVSNESF